MVAERLPAPRLLASPRMRLEKLQRAAKESVQLLAVGNKVRGEEDGEYADEGDELDIGARHMAGASSDGHEDEAELGYLRDGETREERGLRPVPEETHDEEDDERVADEDKGGERAGDGEVE